MGTGVLPRWSIHYHVFLSLPRRWDELKELCGFMASKLGNAARNQALKAIPPKGEAVERRANGSGVSQADNTQEGGPPGLG